jgi:hypothetical protein
MCELALNVPRDMMHCKETKARKIKLPMLWSKDDDDMELEGLRA